MPTLLMIDNMGAAYANPLTPAKRPRQIAVNDPKKLMSRVRFVVDQSMSHLQNGTTWLSVEGHSSDKQRSKRTGVKSMRNSQTRGKVARLQRSLVGLKTGGIVVRSRCGIVVQNDMTPILLLYSTLDRFHIDDDALE